MNRNDCSIVQDLLPNYIENLTSKETNDFIEEHLKTCKECKEMYESMTKNIIINNMENNKKEAKYFKKFNNRLKSLKILIVFILVLVLVVSIFAYNNLKNIIILNSLEEKLSSVNIANYSYTMEMETYNDEKAITNTKCYVLNDKYYIEMEKIDADGKSIIKSYKDNNDDIILYDKNGTLLYKINGETNTKIGMDILPTNARELSYNNCYSMRGNIKEITKEDNYYVIKTKDNYIYWVEKDTGIMVKMLSLEGNYSMSFNYSFGNVKETDIVKPDVSGILMGT